MSCRSNFLLDIPCCAEALPGLAGSRELMSKALIHKEIVRPGGDQKGKSALIFANSLLNSLLAGNCNR